MLVLLAESLQRPCASGSGTLGPTRAGAGDGCDLPLVHLASADGDSGDLCGALRKTGLAASHGLEWEGLGRERRKDAVSTRQASLRGSLAEEEEEERQSGCLVVWHGVVWWEPWKAGHQGNCKASRCKSMTLAGGRIR